MKVINGKIDGFIGANKIYIGRGNVYYNLKQSPLHNPFKISKHCNREQSIMLYKRHLWESIKAMRDGKPLDSIMVELINIARVEHDSNLELMLVCYCSPLPCHGTVIINAINWLKSQDWFIKWIY